MAKADGFNFIDDDKIATSGTPEAAQNAASQNEVIKRALLDRKASLAEHESNMNALKAEFEKLSIEEKRRLGMTDRVRQEMHRRAETPEGVDIEEFMSEFGIEVLDLEDEFDKTTVGGKALAPGARTDLGLV